MACDFWGNEVNCVCSDFISDALRLTAISADGNWNYPKISADGSKVLVAAYGGYIYLSIDGGITLTPLTSFGFANWESYCISGDGSTIYVIVPTSPGVVKKSINNGVSFTTVYTGAGFTFLRGIECSNDGQIVYVGKDANATLANLGVIKSINGGSSFTSVLTNVAGNVKSVSADGAKVVSISTSGGSQLHVSVNGGTSFNSAFSGNWAQAKYSNDGTVLIATKYDPSDVRLYKIVNDTTPVLLSSTYGDFSNVAISNDNQVILVSRYTEYLFISTDGGTTFVDTGFVAEWSGCAMSSDASTVFVTTSPGRIYKGLT
jgi:hypothetical protein